MATIKQRLFCAVFLFLFLASSFSVCQIVSADAPYLAGWNSRLSFYLEGGSPLNASEAVQVQLLVLNQSGTNTVNTTTFYLPNLTQGDFEDLRVTASDGLTLYPVWNQTTISGVNCTFWVKVPSVNATYYLYCSNPSAVNVWDKAAVFVDVVGGVVGAWTMEETNAADPVADYSGNGNTGTATGTTIETTNTKWAGKNDRAFTSGVNNIKFPFSATLPNDLVRRGDWAVFMWIKRSATCGANPDIFWGPGHLPRLVLSATVGQLSTKIATVYTELSTATVANPDGAWRAVIAQQVNNTSSTVAVNGTVNNGAFGQSDINTSDHWQIGKSEDYQNDFVGSVSTYFIKSTAFSADEIIALSNSAYYPDVGLSAGEALVRNYVYTVPVVTAFGVLKYQTEPSPALATEDVLALGVVGGLIILAVAVAMAKK